MTKITLPYAVTFLSALAVIVVIGLSTPRVAAAAQTCGENCARAMGLCMDAATTTGQIDLCADAYDCCIVGCGGTGLPCGDGV